MRLNDKNIYKKLILLFSAMLFVLNSSLAFSADKKNKDEDENTVYYRYASWDKYRMLFDSTVALDDVEDKEVFYAVEYTDDGEIESYCKYDLVMDDDEKLESKKAFEVTRKDILLAFKIYRDVQNAKRTGKVMYTKGRFYDMNNNMYEYDSQIDTDEVANLSFYYKLFMDDNGKIIKDEYYDKKLNQHINEYKYGENGKISQIIYYKNDIIQEIWDYYYQEGKLTRLTKKNSSRKVVVRWQYKYNKSGYLKTALVNNQGFIWVWHYFGKVVNEEFKISKIEERTQSDLLHKVITVDAYGDPVKTKTYTYEEAIKLQKDKEEDED